MEIRYVDKQELAPKYGNADSSTGIARVRNDLWKIVQAATTVHEFYHLTDKAKNPLWREIKAILYSAFAPPIGAAIAAILTLTSKERLSFYLNRFQKGE